LPLALVVDGAVLLVAALLNAGVHVPLGVITLRFSVPVWKAGVGEAVIGFVSSHRVVGAASSVNA
jgi:hypothetical protein